MDTTSCVCGQKSTFTSLASMHGCATQYLQLCPRYALCPACHTRLHHWCMAQAVSQIGHKAAHAVHFGTGMQHYTDSMYQQRLTHLIELTGTIGGTYATPLVNPPEVAIVALGKLRYLPRFAPDGEVEKVAVMNVSWGADHRVVDGATLAEFNNKWKMYVEQPERVLLRLA